MTRKLIPFIGCLLIAIGCLPEQKSPEPTNAQPSDILALNARGSMIFRPDAGDQLQLGRKFSLTTPNTCEVLGHALYSSGRIWLTCSGSGTVVALDATTFEEQATYYLPKSSNPMTLAATSDQQHRFVSLFLTDQIYHQTPGKEFEFFFDLKTLELQSDTSRGPAYPRPQGIVLDKNDNLLVAMANLGYENIGESLAIKPAGPGYLAILDVESSSLKALVPLSGKNATTVKSTNHGIFVTQLGDCDQLGCHGGGISRIDPESFEEISYRAINPAPYSFDIAPDGNDLYVANAKGIAILDAETLEQRNFSAFPDQLCGRTGPLPISYYLSDLVTTDSFVYTLEYNHRCLIQIDRQTLSFIEHRLASYYTSLVKIPASSSSS